MTDLHVQLTRRRRGTLALVVVLVADFAAAFEQQDLTGIPSSIEAAAEQFPTVTDGLGDAEVSVQPGPVTIDDTGAASDLEIVWTFPSDFEWSYATRVDLERTGSDCAVLDATPARGPRWYAPTAPTRAVSRPGCGDGRPRRRRP